MRRRDNDGRAWVVWVPAKAKKLKKTAGKFLEDLVDMVRVLRAGQWC